MELFWEYAYFNIPVLTATNSCPTMNFDLIVIPQADKTMRKI